MNTCNRPRHRSGAVTGSRLIACFYCPSFSFYQYHPLLITHRCQRLPIIACLADLAPCVWPRETAVKSFNGSCVWRTYFFNNVCSQPVTQRSGKQHRSGVLASRRVSRAGNKLRRLAARKGCGPAARLHCAFFLFYGNRQLGGSGFPQKNLACKPQRKHAFFFPPWWYPF